MRLLHRMLTLLVPCVALAACGDNGPPPGAYVGAPCRADYDCPGGLFCVDPAGGTCQVFCRDNFDCGPGYSCHEENRHGTGGKVNVCMPN